MKVDAPNPRYARDDMVETHGGAHNDTHIHRTPRIDTYHAAKRDRHRDMHTETHNERRRERHTRRHAQR